MSQQISVLRFNLFPTSIQQIYMYVHVHGFNKRLNQGSNDNALGFNK